MADTTRENVLTLAPELTDFCSNTRQSVTVTIITAQDSRDYVLSVDNVQYTINSGIAATVVSIAAAMKLEIDAVGLDIKIIDNLDGTLTIESIDAGVRFDIDSDTDSYITCVIDIKAALGENLFNLILEDVKKECIYKRYKDEQERAQRYLAAHLLTVLNISSSSGSSGGGSTGTSTGSTGSVIREKVGDVEVWYSDGGATTEIFAGDVDLMSTKYGKAFLSIRSRHAVRFI